MISSATLRKLAELNLSPEQMTGVLSLLADQAQAEEDRKAAQRERTRKSRASRNAAVTLQDRDGNEDVTLRACDNEETVSLSPVPPSSPPHPPNNPLTPFPIQKTNSARGFRLPEDWSLTGPDLAFALSKGFSEQQTGEIFEKFTNYWWSATGAKATKKNWHQAWKVWVLNTKPMPRAGPSPAKPLTPYQQQKQETKDILDGLKAYATGSDRSGGENPRLLLGNNS